MTASPLPEVFTDFAAVPPTRCPCRPTTSPRTARSGSTPGRTWCCADHARPLPRRARTSPGAAARPCRARPRTPPAWVLGLLPVVFLVGLPRLAGRHDPARGVCDGSALDVLARPATRRDRLVHALAGPGLHRADAGARAAVAYVLHRYACRAARRPARARHGAVRAADGGRGLGVPVGAAARRGSGRSRPSSWPTCSSTSPSWCASSAGSGRSSTRGTTRRPGTLGASPWCAFRTVTWPLLRPAVVAAVRPGLLLHVHVLRRRAGARRPGAPDPRGRDLPADRPAARPARRRRARGRAAARCRRGPAGVGRGCRPGSPSGSAAARPGEVAGDRSRPGALRALVALVPRRSRARRRAAGRAGRRGRSGSATAGGWPGGARCSPLRSTTRDVDVAGARCAPRCGYAVATALIAVVVGGLAACAVAYARRGGRARRRG